MREVDGEKLFTEAEFKSGRREYDRNLLKSIDGLKDAVTQLNQNMALSNQRQDQINACQAKHDLTLYGADGLCTKQTRQEMLNTRLIEADSTEMAVIKDITDQLAGLKLKVAGIAGGIGVATYFVTNWLKDAFKK